MSLHRSDGETEFGSNWGPASVTRCAVLPENRRVIQIKTDHVELDIYVSATGRSVRVFKRGTGELKDSGC